MFNIGKKAAWSAAPLKERMNVRNPYRGMYTICRMHADSPILAHHDVHYSQYAPPPGQSLVLLEINLQAYNQGEIAEAALENIDAALTSFAQRGIQLILRFLYDWEGKGVMCEPQDIQVIYQHMEQLSPLMHKHGDVIYIHQGLFTGSWGEMHNTRFSSTNNMLALSSKLMACTAPTSFIALRRPVFWRTICHSYHPTTWADVEAGVPISRFALYNDAILGSENDLGTYGTQPQSSSVSYTEQFCREDELLFQQNLCRYVPNGGEVVNVSPLNDIKSAVQVMQLMRLSYLNSEYDPDVMAKWAQGNQGGFGGVFRKATDLDYIAAHLGYRYLLLDTRLARMKEDKRRSVLTIRIVNRGFAPCYRPMNVQLVMTAEGQETITVPIETDVRTWQPGKTVELQAALPAAGKPRQRYTAGLRIRCPLTEQDIRLLNTPDPVPEHANPLGEVTL